MGEVSRMSLIERWVIPEAALNGEPGNVWPVRRAAPSDPMFMGEIEVVRASDYAGAVDLLRWALPYLPEPLPSMESGAYAENYDRAMTLSANTPTGGQ